MDLNVQAEPDLSPTRNIDAESLYANRPLSPEVPELATSGRLIGTDNETPTPYLKPIGVSVASWPASEDGFRKKN